MTPQENLPSHFNANQVEDGAVVEDTERGRVAVSIVALPPEDPQSTRLSQFWSRLKTALGGRAEAQTPPIPPTPVAASPRIASDMFKPDTHVQLMGHMPYVVLEGGTRYGISVNVPAGLEGQWEDFQGPTDSSIRYTNRIEIGKRRKVLAVVVRTDDGQPLIRQNLGTTQFALFQEMLSGGFTPAEGDPTRAQLLVQHRITVNSNTQPKLGEEAKNQSVQEPLIFSALGSNTGVGTMGDKKGRVEVVVYQAVEKQVTEIVDQPMPSFVDTRSALSDTFMRGATKGGGFSAGETSFGQEQRRKVNIKGVVLENPLAAFQLVLVGELPNQGLVMTPQT